MDCLVSVVIPVHDGERYVAATLESVLAQTHRPLEVLAVDDGSVDSTAEIVRRYAPQVRLIQQECKGKSAARNTAIHAATGEFLAFIDHDDLWSPEKLERQLACFQRNPELDLVFTHMQNFFTPEMPPEERARLAVPLEPKPGLSQTAMLARRASFLRVGLFAEGRAVGEFLHWYGRALVAGLKSEVLPETLTHRRIHATNFSRENPHLKREYLTAIKDMLDRRRAAQRQDPQ